MDKHIFLHRGIISNKYKENSYRGIKESINFIKKNKTIANGLEIDVCITKDNKFIVYHPKIKKFRATADTSVIDYYKMKQKEPQIFLFKKLLPIIKKNPEIMFLIDLKLTLADKKNKNIIMSLIIESNKNQNIRFLICGKIISNWLEKEKIPYIYMLHTIKNSRVNLRKEKIFLPFIKSLFIKKVSHLGKKKLMKNQVLIISRIKKKYLEYDFIYEYNQETKKNIDKIKNKGVVINYYDIEEYQKLIK